MDGFPMTQTSEETLEEAARLRTAGFTWDDVARGVNTKFSTRETAASLCVRALKAYPELRQKTWRKMAKTQPKPKLTAELKTVKALAPLKPIKLTLCCDGGSSQDFTAEISGIDSAELSLQVGGIGQLKVDWSNITGLIVGEPKHDK